LTVCTALSTSPARTGSQARYYNTLYLKPTYEAAKKKLNLIKRELAILNQSAVYSLEEGMEEKLSLHPFSVFFQSSVSASRLPTVSKISYVRWGFIPIGCVTGKIVIRGTDGSGRLCKKLIQNIRTLRKHRYLRELREAMKDLNFKENIIKFA
jgi:hypothetical protein